MSHSQRLTVLLVNLLFAIPVSFGDTITIVSGQDTTLYENSVGAVGNGSGQHLFAGRSLQVANSVRRALIKFDIAGNVPPGSIIESAELTLSMSRTRTNTTRMIALYRVLSDWGEGESDAPGEEGSGASVEPGDATWVHTFFNTDFWVASGGDFAAEHSAATSVSAIGRYAWGSTTEMAYDVQEWLDLPATNHGWILRGDETTFATVKRFDSRENQVEAQRPVITVEFTTPTAGACCESTTGVCEENVLPDDCADDHSTWHEDTACIAITCELEIAIDIKPGNDANPVNLRARGVLPVAVLTTGVADGDLTDFDAANVDPSSLTLAGAAPRTKGRSGRVGSLADIDGDGDFDLLIHFPVVDLELTEQDTEAVLMGETFDGTPILGTDTISIRGIQRLGLEALRRAE